MARFSAPADTSGIHLGIGHFAVKKGFVEVPDDLSAGDRAGLAANGFTLAPAGDAEPAKQKRPRAPKKPRGTRKAPTPKPEKPATAE